MVDRLAGEGIIDLCGHAAIGVSYENHAGPGFARFAHAPDQAFGGEDRKIHLHTVALAQVNMHIPPPVRGITGDDAGRLDFPWRILLELEQGAQPFVLAVEFRFSLKLDTQFCILAPQLLVLLQQITAWHHGVAGLFRRLLAGTGEAKEGQEEAADRELELRGGARRQLQDDDRQDKDGCEGNVMRLFQIQFTVSGER
jgi:hypothetical protein